MTLRFDHAVIAVHDLQQAMADYRALGFNPFYGGEHAGGKTHNALIVFQDGTYLELLAPTSPALLDSLDPDDRSSFLHLIKAGEGLVAFALYSDDLEADVAAMQSRKVGVTLRPPNGRARPDGQQLQWRSAMLDNDSMNPFFIQDITPRTLRVPDDPAVTTQPNGVIGIAQITVAAKQLPETIDHYQAMTGQKVNNLQQNSANFSIGDVTIRLNLQAGNHSRLSEIQLIGNHSHNLDVQLAHSPVLTIRHQA